MERSDAVSSTVSDFIATINYSDDTFELLVSGRTNTIWCAFLSGHCMMTTKLIKCFAVMHVSSLLQKMKFQQGEAPR